MCSRSYIFNSRFLFIKCESQCVGCKFDIDSKIVSNCRGESLKLFEERLYWKMMYALINYFSKDIIVFYPNNLKKYNVGIKFKMLMCWQTTHVLIYAKQQLHEMIQNL